MEIECIDYTPQTYSLKVRGLGTHKNPTLADITPLAETHIVFNRLVEATCKEILRLRSTPKDADEAELGALMTATLSMPATAGNHLLTRLLQSEGKDNSDKKQLTNLVASQQKVIDRLSTLTTIDQDQSEALANGRVLKDSAERAVRVLERRQSDGYAPWKELGAEVSLPGKDGVFIKVSDLSESWQRQIFQAAIESLKSHFNLKEYVKKEIKEWEKARDELHKVPDIQRYLGVRDSIIQGLNEHGAIEGNINSLSPVKFLAFLKKYGPDLHKWRGTEEALPELSTSTLEAADKWEALPEDSRKRRSGIIRKDALNQWPEVAEVLRVHNQYERSFSRLPSEPTLTIPDPFLHPKFVIWTKQQWREIELDSTPEASKSWLKIRLPTLRITEEGVKEESLHFTVSGDSRLKGITKDGERFILTDPIFEREREVRFGGVRLVVETPSNRRHSPVEPFSADYRLKLIVNRATNAAPEWVTKYKKGEIDSLTNEPLLPNKLIAVSVVPESKGTATLKAAEIMPASHNRRKLRYLRESEFPSNLKVNQIKSPSEIGNFRKLAERWNTKVYEQIAKLDTTPRPTVDTPSEEKLRMRQARRAEIRTLEQTQLIKCKAWEHVTNLGEERVNRIAGNIVRRMEQLRSQYPEHEIALVHDYRADRKPNRHRWSGDFNKLLMSSSSGAFMNKVVEACSRLERPIPTFGFSTYGFGKVAPRHSEPSVLHFNKKDGKITSVPWSENCAVVRRDSKGHITKVSFTRVNEVIADNLLERLVTPSRYKNMPTPAQMQSVLAATWDEAAPILRNY